MAIRGVKAPDKGQKEGQGQHACRAKFFHHHQVTFKIGPYWWLGLDLCKIEETSIAN